MPVEVEAKFSLTAEQFALLESRTTPAGLELLDSRLIENCDTYWDTSDWRLAAAGAGVRSRRVRDLDDDASSLCILYTLKWGEQRGEHFVREEIEEPAEGRDLRGWLLALFDSGRAPLDVAVEHLGAVLRVTSRRRESRLALGGAILELCLDEVQFEGPAGVAEDHELELELAEGKEEDLRRAVALLQLDSAARPSNASKLRRGLELVGRKGAFLADPSPGGKA